MAKDAEGKRIPDLKKEDFEIYEDGVLQEIADFKPAPHPLRLILLFDTNKNTNLFGAMRALFDRVGGRSGNEVVLIFSDGKDSVDRNLANQRPVKDTKQVIREAQENLAQIYAACFKPEQEISGSPFGLGRGGYGSDCKFLSEIAGAGGGRSFEFESQSAFAQVLKKTFDELRSQYTLAYRPSTQGNRVGFHKIKVVVKKQDMIARAREGYLISK